MRSGITLLGASGFTGKLIANLLKENNISFNVAGRDRSSLMEISGYNKIFEVDVFNKKQIISMLDHCDILINTVGPFNYFSKEIMNEVSKKGIIYLDITGEQECIKYANENLNKPCKEQGSIIVNSCSFESFFADCLATEICEQEKIYKNISSFYYFNKSLPSKGTRLTMKLAKVFPTYILTNGELNTAKPLDSSKNIKININHYPNLTHGAFMPYPEIIFFNKRYNVIESGSYLALEEELALMANDTLQHNQSPEKILQKFYKRKYKNPTVDERINHEFVLALRSVDEQNKSREVCLSGKDMYGLTAQIIMECVKSIQNERPQVSGVFSPAEIFANRGVFKKIVEKNNLSLHYSE